MPEKLKYFLLIVSFSFSLMHNFIAHSHDNRPNSNIIANISESTDHLFDLITHLFSLNLGVDHLEYFNRGNKICDEIQFQNYDFEIEFHFDGIDNNQIVCILPVLFIVNEIPETEHHNKTINRGPPNFF